MTDTFKLIKESLEAAPHLQRLGRLFSETVLIEIDGAEIYLHFEKGRIVSVVEGPSRKTPWRFSLRTDAEALGKFWLASEMQTYGIKPEIEAFDLSHIFRARDMADQGQLAGTPYIQFVMGVKNAMPADRDVFDHYIRTVRRLFGEDAPWCAAGIGANQLMLNEWAIAAGGHARTGLEDNVRLDRDTLAPSNAALVRRAVEICERNERPVASWQDARRILDLRRSGDARKGQAA